MVRLRILLLLLLLPVLVFSWETNGLLGDQCRWYGTSPFCMGTCPRGHTEVYTASDPKYFGIGGFRITDKAFGRVCLTGQKAYCCHG